MTHKKLFLFFLLFVLIAGGILQKVIIPLTPWNAGHGLLKGGDWYLFHSEAVAMADRIKASGWGAWELRYRGNSPIAITAILYFLTGIYEPWVVLPLNGCLYALAAIVLFDLFKFLSPRKWVSYAAIAPMVLFPSTAMIWGQIHKDIWTLPGMLLIMAFWVKAFGTQNKKVNTGMLLLKVFLGSFLIWVVRPYLNRLFFIGGCFGVVGGVVLIFLRDRRMSLRLILAVVLGLLLQTPFLLTQDSLQTVSDYSKSETGFVWERSKLPSFIDNQLSKVAVSRERFRTLHPDAGTNIDQDRGFHNVSQIFRYVPRALQISLFSPFPTMWIAEGKNPGAGFMRLSAAIEMCVLYISLLGLLAIPKLLKNTGNVLSCSLICSWVVVIIYALVVCNVGTLYRMRYPIMLFWMGIGWLGWEYRFNKAK